MENIKLSIIVVSYNSLQLLESCLGSIYRNNDIGKALEVILVDNASFNQAEVVRYSKTHYPEVKVLVQPINTGYGTGNNLGIRHSRGRYVMIMNPDVQLHKPFFRRALSFFTKYKAQALLGLQQVDQFGRNVHSFLMRRLTVQNFCINFILQKLRIFLPQFSVISGACFLLDKEKFQQVGGFDEEVFLYGEERLLHERLLRIFPRARVTIDFGSYYTHPISDRPFSIAATRQGLLAYFKLRTSLGDRPARIYREVIAYHRFLILFYWLKQKKTVILQVKQIISLIKDEFRERK